MLIVGTDRLQRSFHPIISPVADRPGCSTSPDASDRLQPNNSFKPSLLRGLVFAVTSTATLGRYAGRLNSGVRCHLEDFRRQLRRILELVRSCEPSAIVRPMHTAATGSDDQLIAYLKSNELWGGSGSVADQAGLSSKTEHVRRSIEKRLLELGEMQSAAGILNPRTEMWTEAFRSHHLSGT